MFKVFPEFAKLTINDEGEYKNFTKSYPPIGDISFGNLMLWWDTLGGLAISRLNGNLVISYWIPGDEEHSGLSLIGENRVDESICTIFDYLSERGERPRLVNVPEFVVNSLRYPELFAFKSARGDDEYLIATSKFAVLDGMPKFMRSRAKRFIREIGEEKIAIKNVDLYSLQQCKDLLNITEEWPLKGVNNISKLEREALPNTLSIGAMLGVQCMGLYVEGILQAYCLYLPSNDPQYAGIPHARINYDVPRIFDYAVHAFCKFLKEKGVDYINIDADNGSLQMRALKIALKPDNFFRKYSVEPL